MGQYMYKVDMPIQFICSGKFKDSLDFCGISPQSIMILADSSGFIYGRTKVSLRNILTLGCGDIDEDGTDESVVLGRGGDIEIYKFANNRLNRIYSGKIGEDIMPETFYVEKGIVVVGISGDKRVFYSYDFKDNKFVFKNKKYAKISDTTMISRIGSNILISHVYRNNMAFRVGRIQRLEMYNPDSLKRLYNFGGRTGRRYSYYVRTLENTMDIDGDGIEEIVLKAVGRDDVMGQGYIVEVYKTSKPFLLINRILSAIEDII
jgi:hypothetical protein